MKKILLYYSRGELYKNTIPVRYYNAIPYFHHSLYCHNQYEINKQYARVEGTPAPTCAHANSILDYADSLYWVYRFPCCGHMNFSKFGGGWTECPFCGAGALGNGRAKLMVNIYPQPYCWEKIE